MHQQAKPVPRAASPAPVPDFDAIKARQQATWSAGDFGRIGVRLQIVGETLCEAVDLQATDRVLDVAAGNGNASLAAARHFADVTSTDYVPALLEQGRLRAAADRLPIAFQEADAEALPFDDRTFDVVLSSFGVMFAPDHERAAGELLRVCRGGGRIGLANWTPRGFIGQLFKVMGRHVPPPPGLVTRTSSPAARSWSGANMMPNDERTTSKDAAGNGSASASATWKAIGSRSASARRFPCSRSAGT